MRRVAPIVAGVALLAVAAWLFRGGGPRWEVHLTAGFMGHRVEDTKGGPLLAMPLGESRDPWAGPDVWPLRGPLTVIDKGTGRTREMWDESLQLSHVGFSPDGGHVAGVHQDEAGRWTPHLADVRAFEARRLLLGGKPVSAEFSPGGESLFVQVMDGGAEADTLVIDPDAPGVICRLAVDPGPPQFLGDWCVRRERGEPERLLLWDYKRRRVAGRIEAGLAFDAGGGPRAVARRGGELRLLDIADPLKPRLIGTANVGEDEPLARVFTGDRMVAAWAGAKEIVLRAWDFRAGRMLWERGMPEDPPPARLHSSGGRVLVAGKPADEEGTPGLRMFDLETGAALWSAPDLSMLRDGISPDGRWIAAAGREGRRVRLLDAATGEGEGVALPGGRLHLEGRFAGGRLWLLSINWPGADEEDAWAVLPHLLLGQGLNARLTALDPGKREPALSLTGAGLMAYFPLEDGSGVITEYRGLDGTTIRRHDIVQRAAWRSPLGLLLGLVGVLLLIRGLRGEARAGEGQT